MKVYVVYGKNNLMNATGPVGVAKTQEGAAKIVEKNDWVMDDHKIGEFELED